MRTLMIAIAALAATTFAAAAQTPKPSVGSEQVYWVLTVSVDELDKFKPIVQQLVTATQKEPGALEYEYTVGSDGKTIDIFERYADSKAAISHLVDNFVPNYSKEFLALAKPTRFVIYGSPTDEFKKTVADFKPIYMTPINGFTR